MPQSGHGKTLLRGFIDTHGHFIYFGKNLVDADLFDSESVVDVVARLKAHVLDHEDYHCWPCTILRIRASSSPRLPGARWAEWPWT